MGVTPPVEGAMSDNGLSTEIGCGQQREKKVDSVVLPKF